LKNSLAFVASSLSFSQQWVTNASRAILQGAVPCCGPHSPSPVFFGASFAIFDPLAVYVVVDPDRLKAGRRERAF
jgi:hypothetical protein